MPAIEILFQNDALVVVNKAPGVLSQKSERGEPGLTELLPEQTGSPVFPVHRLDRETGGVMVYAKTRQAAAALSASLQNGLFRKEYLAILNGRVTEPEGTLEHLLFFDRARGKVFPVKRERRGVKKARLSYRVAGERGGQTLVRVFPETGRTHQIRVQFAAVGAPLAGDRRYGGGTGQLALHCRALLFPDPVTQKKLLFSAPPGGMVWEVFRNEIQVLSNGDFFPMDSITEPYA